MARKKSSPASRKKTAARNAKTASKQPETPADGGALAAASMDAAPATADQLPERPASDYAFIFQRGGGDRGVAAAGLSFEVVDHGADGAIARVCNDDPAAQSAGRTGGWSIRVPDSLEAAAGGKAVTVSICARAANGGPSAEFSGAYSTNEVGNSGWQRFVAGPGWQLFSFCYNVNPMVNGKGDFIGILPAPAGEPGIDIGFVTAQVVERPA